MLATKEKPHPAFQLPTAVLHQGFALAISNTATSFDAASYENRSGPLSSAYFRDSETGLDYAKNRYHQPGMGRFLTPDPYMASGGPGDPGSWNRYAYAGGDPIKYKDPRGREECDPDEGDDCGGDSFSAGSGDEGAASDPSSSCYGNYFVATGQEGCPSYDDGEEPAPAAPKQRSSYFLTVTNDCYLVPANGGPVTREITYQLNLFQPGMPKPIFTNTGIIWEHLTSATNTLPVSGANSASSGPPGTFADTQSIVGGAAYQQITQSFTAVFSGGNSIGLGIYAPQFGGADGWNQSLNIQKYANYVSINGNVGGKLDSSGKLIPGTYTPCN